MSLLFVVITVIVVALIFDFTNGFHDSANAMAGPIATGALKPRTAVVIAAVLNVVGAFLSTEVAKTISGGFFDDQLVTAPIVLAGLVGAIVWNLLTWLLGLPSSSSHALFGGLIGAVMVGAGLASVNYSVIVSKVLLPAVVAPVVAGLAAAAATALAYRITRPTPSTHSETGFKYGQAFTASMVALAHGTSDGQKTMGVITLVLVVSGFQASGTGPQMWVVAGRGSGHRPGHVLGWLADHAHHGQGHRRDRDAAGCRLRRGDRRDHPRLGPSRLRPVHHPRRHRRASSAPASAVAAPRSLERRRDGWASPGC